MPSFTPLPESSRRHYLNAMGIESWYPRVRLPAAPEPLLFDLDDTEPAPTPMAQAAAPTPAVERPAQTTAVPRLEMPSAKAPAAQSEPDVAPAAKAQVAPAVPRFVLSLSVVGPFLIADTLARGLEQPTSDGQQLLLNILAALGVSADEVRTHHVIQWPLFTNPRVDQGLTQARLYVDEKLEQFIRQFQPTHLLSFGAVLPRLHDWQQPQGDHLGLPWLGLPSLYRMLSEPGEKAVAWQRLKPLVPTQQ
ncbi:hypothetical protein [Saccharospirillum mangrovi]|uniref:hypothetical protein n=1 Tax=Saccharospirillum mangrovi TaxID=2161747 RepID=UPI0013004745|nr:hypothetical protein [Saccharospirillum mangrovi]